VSAVILDAKGKRKVIADMLAEPQRDMVAAVEQMPDDWDETELVSCAQGLRECAEGPAAVTTGRRH
jgi:hypothetical protein